MPAAPPTIARAASRRCRAMLVLALAPVVLGACGGSPDAGTAQAATTTRPATTAVTTQPPSTTSTSAAPPTTTSPPSTSTTAPAPSSTSTTSTTTVARQATAPIPPPADPDATEPVIELGRLLIPAIGVDMAMYEGIRLTTLDYGPGHWPGSAMPGQPGNVVVGGHRTSKHRVFRNVDDLVAGDEVVFVDPDGARHVYLVNRVEIVEQDAMWIVDPTDTPTATLFACHPPGSTRQRIVVFADLRA